MPIPFLNEFRHRSLIRLQWAFVTYSGDFALQQINVRQCVYVVAFQLETEPDAYLPPFGK